MFERKTLWFVLMLAAVAMVVVMAGCGDDDDDVNVSSQQSAFLSGAQVVPGSNSLATGTATVTFVNLNDSVRQNRQARFRLVTSGLANVTTVQLGLGLPGETGPVLFTLFNRANAGTQFPTDFTRTIRADQWVPVAGINTFEEFVNAVRAGRVYIIANTVANPNGAIRGQFRASRFALTFTGQPTSTVTPTAVVTVDELRKAIRVQMPNVGIPNATAVTMVLGGLGGQRLFVLREQPAGPLGALDVTLREDRLIRIPAANINNFNDFLNALYAGEVFIQIDTAAFPGGEFIARISPPGGTTPTIFSVAMSSTNFTPQTVRVAPGAVIRFRNDTLGPLTVVADSTNLVAGGPNSAIDFPTGIPAGQIYEFTVPAGSAAGTNFFYHEALAGTAGTGTTFGTGMTGVVRVI